jgi:hypothetical protein
MSKKDKCVKIMQDLFGPVTAQIVEKMSEDEVVAKCRQKVEALLGEDKAKIFDDI